VQEKRSLLQVVSEKESELNKMLDIAAKDAEEAISRAKREAGEIVRKAEKEAIEAADRYKKEEQKKLELELDAIKEDNDREATIINERSERNLPSATGFIVKNVKGP
jgi:vacuolar-type H+-ATPase subunit H